MIKSRLLLVVATLLLSVSVHGEWVQGKAEYRFGPDLTENEACKRSKRRAQEDAMRKVSGERISSDDTQVCAELKDSVDE